MKEKTKFQKKYNKLKRKMYKSGFELSDDIVIPFKNEVIVSIDTIFILPHGETEDSDSFMLPKKLVMKIKDLTEITFKVSYNDDDSYLYFFYNGKKVGGLCLDYKSEFTQSWKDYKKLTFEKGSDNEWFLKEKALFFLFNENEHIDGSFQMKELKISEY